MGTLLKTIYGGGPLRAILLGGLLVGILAILMALSIVLVFYSFDYRGYLDYVFMISFVIILVILLGVYRSHIETIPPYRLRFIQCFGQKTHIYVKNGNYPYFPPIITFLAGEDDVNLGPQKSETAEFFATTLDLKKMKAKIVFSYQINEGTAYLFTRAHGDTFLAVTAAAFVDDFSTIVASQKWEEETSLLRVNRAGLKAEILKSKDYKDLAGRYGFTLLDFEIPVLALEDEEDKDADAEKTREEARQRGQLAKMQGVITQIKALQADLGISYEEAQELWMVSTGNKIIHKVEGNAGLGFLNLK